MWIWSVKKLTSDVSSVHVRMCVLVGLMHRQACPPLFVVSTLKEDCEGPEVCMSV